MELDENQVKRYIDTIAQIRRVLVPYPPKFEIFTIEATRIKLKVWDQTNSNNKMAKKEKTEFLARIAEQLPRNNVFISDDETGVGVYESNDKIIEEGMDKKDNNIQINDAEDEKKDEIDDGGDNDEEEEDVNVNIMDEDEEHKYEIKSRESNKIKQKNKKRKKKKIDWDQYPVFKPHDMLDRKVISNKYTVWIENLSPNTTYLLKLRGYNKYG
eukprot:794624_1